MMVDSFLPTNLATTTLSVTAAAQTLRIPTGTVDTSFPSRSGGEYLEISNSGSVAVFVETSPGSNVSGTETPTIVATVAASYPILSGQCKIIRRAPGDTHLSIIGASAGPTSVFVSVGNGI